MKQSRLLPSVLVVCASVAYAVEPSTEAWEYQVWNWGQLSSVRPDPTRDCKPAQLLAVLGHLGWELVQVTIDESKEIASVKGAIELNAVTAKTSKGTIQLQSQSTGASTVVIFKRHHPHVAQDLKCPS
ncbi:MAG: hypothetical protein EON58_00155 [Alphaproteobacteria bacterium]|nr:MAG: hypothetical protein EON58_00155 [Alphaproteobacteria bacterium]